MNMKLTKNNYYSTKNKYLTSSRIKDYIRDPWFFYRKHVLGEIETPVTPSMLVGSAADAWLTQSKAVFQAKYKPVERRNLKNPPNGYTEMTPADYNRAVAISTAVERTQLYKQIKKEKYKSQNILFADNPIGHFLGIAGIPDWYKVDGTRATIIDLKTTTNTDIDKFRWICKDYGYFLQAAVYQMLVMLVYPEVTECDSYILAVENDDTINRVGLFLLNPESIEIEKEKVMNVIDQIANTTEWKPQDIKGFGDAILI